MTSVYYKYSHGAIVTFDLARRETFLAGLAWLADYTAAMELEGEEAAPVVMVGNKSDCDTGDQVSVGYTHSTGSVALAGAGSCLSSTSLSRQSRRFGHDQTTKPPVAEYSAVQGNWFL